MNRASKWMNVFAVAAALMSAPLAAGCGAGQSGPVVYDGAIHMSLAVNQADITSVVATISAPDIDPPIVEELVVDNGAAVGTILGVPAGTDRLISVVAYEGATEVCDGSAVVDVAADEIVQVYIFLQCAPSGTPSGGVVIDGQLNFPPTITSVFASAVNVDLGGSVTLRARATDPDGDPVSYAWSTTCGSYTDPNVSDTTWIAPSQDGTCALVVRAMDGNGGETPVALGVMAGFATKLSAPRIEGASFTCNTDGSTANLALLGANFANADGGFTGAKLGMSDPNVQMSPIEMSINPADGWASLVSASDTRVVLGPVSADQAGSEAVYYITNDKGTSVSFRVTSPAISAICNGGTTPYVTSVRFGCTGNTGEAYVMMLGRNFESSDGTFNGSALQLEGIDPPSGPMSAPLDPTMPGSPFLFVSSTSFALGPIPAVETAGVKRFVVTTDRGSSIPVTATIPDLTAMCL